MENKRPEFAIAEHSVLSVVTELHNYFRDLQSYYKIAHGEIISQLETSTDEDKNQKLRQQLDAINEKIAFFHVLNNATSTVDTVLHTPTMIAEFKESQ